MIKLAVFDLDGTLVNSLYDLADAVNKALREGGFREHDYDEYRYFVGNGAAKLIERALPKGTPEEVQKRIHAGFSSYYKENCLAKTRPYDGIKEMLAEVRAAGIACAVASNKPDEFSGQVVTALFGEGVFDLIRGKLEGTPTKPSPDIIFSIAQTLGIDTADAVMIGDSSVDVETAHNAGIPCIGCTWGFRGEKELRDAGAEHIAHKPQDIANILLNGL